MEGSFALSRPGVRIVPSLLAADFSRLADEVRAVERGGAEVLHLDVMDGHFVPNITFGPGVIAALRPHSGMFFDAHLMIDEPLRYAEAFAKAGSDLITFSIEATQSPQEVVDEIRRQGKAVGVAINPGTPVSAIKTIVREVDLVLVMSVWPGFGGQKFIPDVLPKLGELRSMLGPQQRLEVDGGIDADTIVEVVRAGADTIVAGTAVFGQADPPAALGNLRRRAMAATREQH